MPIPAGAIPVTDLDATSDSPASARASALLPVVQQFNTLIASANGATGMAVLDASGFLAGYGRTGAANTWTGVQTYSGASPVLYSSASPFVRGRNTSVALPNGLWQLLLPWTDGAVYFQKNTAAAGDFSTSVNVLQLSQTAANFAVPVTGSSATAAGHFVTKGQLESKVVGAQITNSGVAASFTSGTGPAGWSVVRNSVGLCTITHNLGSLAYSVVVSPFANFFPSISAHVQSIAANSFAVYTWNAGALADLNFNFVFVATT